MKSSSVTLSQVFFLVFVLYFRLVSGNIFPCPAPRSYCDSRRDPDDRRMLIHRPICGATGSFDDKYLLQQYPCVSSFSVCKDLCFLDERCYLFTFDPLNSGGTCKLANSTEVFDVPDINKNPHAIGEQVFYPRCFIVDCQGLSPFGFPGKEKPRASWFIPFIHTSTLSSQFPVNPWGIKTALPTPTRGPVSKPSCSTVRPLPAGPTTYAVTHYGSGHTINKSILQSALGRAYGPVIHATDNRIYASTLTECEVIQACSSDAVNGYNYKVFFLELTENPKQWRCQLIPINSFPQNDKLFDQVDKNVIRSYAYTLSRDRESEDQKAWKTPWKDDKLA